MHEDPEKTPTSEPAKTSDTGSTTLPVTTTTPGEPLSASLKAVGEEPPIVSRLIPAEEVREASLENIEKAEATLSALLTTIQNDEVKKALLKRFQEDKDLIEGAGIAKLNDAEKESPLEKAAGTVGLAARQQATKAAFAEQLKKLDATEKAEKEKEILKELDQLQQMRQTKLQEGINEENQKRMKRGDDLFYNYMGLRQGITARPMGSPAQSSFNTDLASKQQKSFESSNHDDKKKVDIVGNEFTSHDPKALGYAMVAAGHKRIEFSGHPRNALEACIAALDAGAEDVDIDKLAKEMLTNQYSGVYDSYTEHKALNDTYKAIRARVAAKKIAREETPNTLFNKDVKEIDQKVTTFGHLHTELAQSQFLMALTPAERVELASKLRDKYNADGIKNMDGYGYINYLLHKYPLSTPVGHPAFISTEQMFQDGYRAMQTSPAKTTEFKNLTDAREVGQFIAEVKTPEGRKHFFNQIKEMNGAAGVVPTIFRTKARAACIGAIVDEGFKKIVSNSNLTPQQRAEIRRETQKEIHSLLNSDVTPDQRMAIKTIFSNTYHRAGNKIALYNNSPGVAAAARINPSFPGPIKLPEDKFGLGEGYPDTLITNQRRFDLYRGLTDATYDVFKALDERRAPVLPAEPAPVVPQVGDDEAGFEMRNFSR